MMHTPDYPQIRSSLKTLFDGMEKLSLVNSYNSEHDAAQRFADWFQTNTAFFQDHIAGYGNHNIIPYAASYILNYIRTYINRYEEEARLALTDGPRVQALIIKHGFAKVVKESIYNNPGVTSIIQGYREFHDETFVAGCNDSIVNDIPKEMNSDALMYIFGKTMPDDKASAMTWLAHYLMLAPSCEKADSAVKQFNDTFFTTLPEISPKRLLEYKSSTIDAIVQKLDSIVNIKPVVAQPTKTVDDVSDDSFLDLPTTRLVNLTDEKLSNEEIVARQSYENTPEVSGIEDIALSYGIPIVSGESWKRDEFARNTPILVKNFDFRNIKKTDLGRANYLLIAPTYKKDVRIEIKSQSVAGTAGDKLPVSIRRYRNWSSSNVYNQTIVAVLGNTSLFSKESLEMAREEALSAEKSNPGKVRYVEGLDAFNNVLQQTIKDVVEQFEATKNTKTPVTSELTPSV